MKRSLVISLIGRPNVGKSSIFNSLMRKANKALAYNKPGVTRDRHYGIAGFHELYDKEPVEAILVDTGGFYPQKIDENKKGLKKEEQNFNKFFNIMTEHAKLAIDESDLVLFVVDVREGIIPFDQSIADYVRTSGKPFWLLVNKYDSDKQMGTEVDFYSLGINPDDMFLVSASHGFGLTELRERLHGTILSFCDAEKNAPLLQKGVTPREDVVGRLAIIGAPNVGKSTLLNNLLGAKRALVSDIAGTTVDPIEGFFDIYFGNDAVLLDEKDFGKFPGSGLKYSNRELLEQYDHFRMNNGDVYQKMLTTYQEEDGELDADDELDSDSDFIPEMSEDDSIENIYQKVFEKCSTEDFSDVTEVMDETGDSTHLSKLAKKSDGSFWKTIHIVDTAGIRRQSAVDGFIESHSVFRSLRSVTEADIVICMVDSEKGVTHQDRRLIDIALEKGKSVIVCFNKMDLIEEKLKDTKSRKEWLQNVRDVIPWLDFCDIVTISAKYNRHIKELKRVIAKTVMIRRKKISTGELNKCLFGLVEKHSIFPKRSRGKRLRIKYASMVKSTPPTFLLFTNRSKGIPETYRRYLKNGLRQQFDFANTPLHLIFRTGRELGDRKTK